MTNHDALAPRNVSYPPRRCPPVFGSRRARLVALVLVALVATAAGCRSQRAYPNRPILLVCPWSAGGGTDRVSRQVAALLEQELGVPVNVVNATGGAGVTGHTRGAIAQPDGYTLTMATVELHMLHWRGLTSVSYKDYEPVALLNRDATAVFVRNDSPYHNIDQLELAIREAPGKLRASGTTHGGAWHLGMTHWLLSVGLKPADVNWIPFNGSTPSLQELMAGGLDFVCCSLPEAQTLVEGNQLRCLGVMSQERIAQFPDIPTFIEQGRDCTFVGWRGIVLPKDTPPEVVDRVAEALHKVVENEQFREFMDNSGFNVSWAAPDEFRAILADDYELFGKLFNDKAFQMLRRTRFGPMFFPKVLGVLIVLVTVVLLITKQLKPGADVAPFSWPGLWRAGEIAVWVIAYLLVVEYVGFVLTAGVLLMLLIWRMGIRLPLAVATTLVVVPLAYQVFAVALRVPLPRGWFGW